MRPRLPMVSPPPPAPRGFRAVALTLGQRDFALYAAGNLVSLSGAWAQRLVAAWVVWEMTASAFWVGLVAFADLAPSVLIAPIAGAAADRSDGRRLLAVTHWLGAAVALVTALLLALEGLAPWSLALLTAALGTCLGFGQATRLTLVPSLVPPDRLPSALALNAIAFNIARFSGAAVAGLVLPVWGPAPAFCAVALALLALPLALALMRPAARPTAGSGAEAGLLAAAWAGIRYAAGHAGIGPILLNLAVLSVLVRPVVELMPAFADRVFGAGPQGLALLMGALGLGAIANGLYLAQRGAERSLLPSVLRSTAVLGLMILLFLTLEELWLALPVIGVAGFCLLGTAVGTQTLLQTAVDPALRGRVLSLYALVIRGAPALGALLMGAAGETLGLAPPLVVGTLTTLAILGWLVLRRRRIAAALARSSPE